MAGLINKALISDNEQNLSVKSAPSGSKWYFAADGNYKITPAISSNSKSILNPQIKVHEIVQFCSAILPVFQSLQE